MKNRKKIIYIVLCIVIFAATINEVRYGYKVRKSYQNNVEFNDYLKTKNLKVQNSVYPYDEDYDLYGKGEKISKFSDLQKKSDIIVKIKLNSGFHRKIYKECIFSEAEILKCYKGNLKKGQRIQFFEPVDCTGCGNPMLLEEGYTPMNENTEYFVFFMKVRDSYFGKNKYVYLPVSLTYGKYNITAGNPKLFKKSEASEDVTDIKKLKKYSEVRNEEVFLYDKKKYELFIQLKKQVLEKYHDNVK